MADTFFNLINHVSIGTNDLENASRFYDSVFKVLGAKRQLEIPDIAVAYGVSFPEFWVQKPINQAEATIANGTHFGFHVVSTSIVDEFYEEAIRLGGRDAGKPGPRPKYGETYYSAYVFDIDGHKIEAMYMTFNKE